MSTKAQRIIFLTGFAIGVLCPLLLGTLSFGATIPAFPGAEGFGGGTPGGRGGRVIEVTNLNDHGPGSLREAIDASGPRTVIFLLGGTIELESRLVIKNPFITIAGQTAPGGGVAIRNGSNVKDCLIIESHDVIIRYLRVRPGSGGKADGISILGNNAYNVIIDHCSISWAVDENISVVDGSHDITIQRSIISEALSKSTHYEGNHSMGLLVNGNGTYNISILRNAFIHNYGRNPRVKANGTVDVINNVIYNYGYGGGFSSNNGNLSVNYIGNFVIRGKNSKKGEIRPSIFEARVYPPEIGNSISIYVEGNIGPNRLSVFDKEAAVVDPEGRKYITSARSPRLHSIPAMKAYVEVLADAGVSQGIDSSGRKLFRRDPVDIRLVNDVRKRIGGIIDDPAEVGGWPLIEKGDGIVDSDHDGMPDVYEIMNGFKHLDPVDGSGDADEDGYTNLEEYLNGTVPIKNAH